MARQLSAAVTGTDIKGPRALVQISALPLLIHVAPPVNHLSVCQRLVCLPHWAARGVPEPIHDTWHLVRAQNAGNKAYIQVLYHCQGGGKGEVGQVRGETYRKGLERHTEEVEVRFRGTLIFLEQESANFFN